MVVLSQGICGRDVSDVIVEVHALNVPGVFGTDLLQTVVSLPVVFKVYPAELSLNFCADVVQGEVLVDHDVSPMRDSECLGSFCEDKKWVCVIEE